MKRGKAAEDAATKANELIETARQAIVAAGRWAVIAHDPYAESALIIALHALNQGIVIGYRRA